MQIKFITINTWFGGKIWDNLVSFIEVEKPDIIALQEVYDGHDKNLEKRYRTMEEFSKIFSNFLPYHIFGATVNDTSVNVHWGNAIFSKFPIRASKTIFFDLPFTDYNFATDPDPRLAAEGMLEGEISLDKDNIFVYSWHGPWNNHGGDSKERFVMRDKIIESLKDKEKVILAGDSNMNNGTQVIKDIEEKLNLTNVFGDTLTTTFNMKRKNIPELAHESVDKVFVTKNIKVLRKEMSMVDISDHHPLKVILEV